MFRTAAVAALSLASASAYKLAEEQLLKRDGAHAHEHTDSGYGAPPATYEEPAASYGAPAPSYGAPETGYGPPAETYGVPSYEEEPLPDLTPIIVGILVLTGLSLLFPTFVSLSDVRKNVMPMMIPALMLLNVLTKSTPLLSKAKSAWKKLPVKLVPLLEMLV